MGLVLEDTLPDRQSVLGWVTGLRTSVLMRGYSANDVDKVRRNVKWENKRDILTKREEKMKKGKGKVLGIVVVIEDKPGLREWWKVCTGKRITNSIGSFFSDVEIGLLPEGLFRCVKTT